MICHRGIGAANRIDGARQTPGGCVGSACPMWVPEVTRKGGAHGTHDVLEPAPANPRAGDGKLTNLGWCADNLRRAPWADPTVPAGKGGGA